VQPFVRPLGRPVFEQLEIESLHLYFSCAIA
jgi:hypothetical protein